MVLQALLLYLASTSTSSRNASSADPNNGRDPEKGPDTLDSSDFDKILRYDTNDAFGGQQDGLSARGNVTVNPPVPRRSRRLSSATVISSFSNTLSSVNTPSWLHRLKVFIFPPKENINSFIPNYRIIPIISGVIIPFSILLELPGLTEHWYIRTEDNKVVEHRPNPLILDVGLGFSVACALIANVCLIMRFLEKRVKTMTILCATFLTVHDLINTTAIIIFGIEHRFDDGFTYGQAFWMTVCSTAVSSFTNATLLWDLYRTPDFNNSGSGLTRNQRSLVIIIIILFCYICFGALINSILQDLSFINGLYFTLVSVETIGFGDIVPQTTGARIFVLVYSMVGILNLGVAIATCRETVLEALEVGYRRRVKEVRGRRKEGRRRRRVEARWRQGIEWRLREMNVPVWVRNKSWVTHRAGGGGRGMRRINTLTGESKSILRTFIEWTGLSQPKIGHSHVMHGPSGMSLNLKALTHAQLEASALEAGVPLSMLLPSDFVMAPEETTNRDTVANGDESSTILPGWAQHPLARMMGDAFQPNEARTLTHARVGGMAALLTRFAVAVIQGHAMSPDELENENRDAPDGVEKAAHHHHSHDIHSYSDHHDFGAMEEMEKKAFYEKLIVAWSLFLVFWCIGSAIFTATEGWSYGTSMYFCFVAFTTIGFGDFSPKSPAGRSVFVVWALLGVGTMTIMISVLQEAYNSRYRSALHIGAFDKAVKRYRQRVDHTKPARRKHHHLHLRGHGDLPSTSHSSLIYPYTQGSSGAANSRQPPTPKEPSQAAVSELHTRVQDHLQGLPDHVFHHAKIIYQYIRFFVDGGHHDQEGEVSGRLRKLIDEISSLGGIGKVTKDELLQDEAARHTLFMLSVEKALHKLIDVAEDALQAVQERDSLVAQLQERLAQNAEGASLRDRGSIYSVDIQ